MKKLILIALMLLAFVPVFAETNLYIGPTVLTDTASKKLLYGAMLGGEWSFAEPEDKVKFTVSNSAALVLDGSNVTQCSLDLFVGAGVTFTPVKNLDLSIIGGPNGYFTIGNSAFLMCFGAGVDAKVAYAISNPGLSFTLGGRAEYEFLFTSSNPFVLSAYLGIGYMF